MKQYFRRTSEKGFLTIATVILMVASMSIIMTLLYRSAQENLLVSNIKKSNASYATSDYSLEIALHQVFEYYEDPANSATTKIPQGVGNVASACAGSSVACYTASGNKITTTDTSLRLTSVSRLETSTLWDGKTPIRFIQADVPPRVPTPSVTNFSAVQVGGSSNVKISWDMISDSSDIYSEVEVRRAELTGAQIGVVTESERQALLSDPSIDWKIVDTRKVKNTTQITDTTSQSGKTYTYILKATNRKPMMLDSLYITPTLPITLP